ncbi:STAS domain-containing protein [Kitasatospora terrestris]|uniref:Anti-sigma factor antagonist n=1 Tax=Kitasatospora terrestris TaxID=258051 RepID=A0ABP9EKR8_9ACTN
MDTALSVSRRPAPPGVTVVALHGSADLDSAAVLAGALRRVLATPPAPGTLVVDCSGVSFCSSSGLNELLRARRVADEAGVVFRLASPSRQVARLLTLTGADTVFDVVPAELPA